MSGTGAQDGGGAAGRRGESRGRHAGGDLGGDPGGDPGGRSARGGGDGIRDGVARGTGSDGGRDVGPDAGRDPAPARPAPRGADLARAALDAARQRNAAGYNGSRGGRRGAAPGGADPVRGETSAAARRLLRRRWSGPGADRARDPQRIGDTVRSWLAGTGAGPEVTKATLFARWAELVGADIAAHASPVSLVDGELVLQAESTAWATQLRLLAPGMIAKINAAVGRGTVGRIRTRGPSSPSWRFGNRHVPGRGPRDTYG